MVARVNHFKIVTMNILHFPTRNSLFFHPAVFLSFKNGKHFRHYSSQTSVLRLIALPSIYSNCFAQDLRHMSNFSMIIYHFGCAFFLHFSAGNQVQEVHSTPY